MAVTNKYRVHVHMDYLWGSSRVGSSQLMFAIESTQRSHAEAVAKVQRKAFPDAHVKITEVTSKVTSSTWVIE